MIIDFRSVLSPCSLPASNLGILYVRVFKLTRGDINTFVLSSVGYVSKRISKFHFTPRPNFFFFFFFKSGVVRFALTLMNVEPRLHVFVGAF